MTGDVLYYRCVLFDDGFGNPTPIVNLNTMPTDSSWGIEASGTGTFTFVDATGNHVLQRANTHVSIGTPEVPGIGAATISWYFVDEDTIAFYVRDATGELSNAFYSMGIELTITLFPAIQS